MSAKFRQMLRLAETSLIVRLKVSFRLGFIGVAMDNVAERCWAQLEGLRHRVHSVCNRSDPQELSSIDAELIEVRDLVWRSLQSASRQQGRD
jgi:hypothetical protein